MNNKNVQMKTSQQLILANEQAKTTAQPDTNDLLVLQLSFIVRLVPSPDWFVGIDSLNLCEGDNWIENLSLDLYPYDAGTDSGFTFSSPNFETIPQDKITQVMSKSGQPYKSYLYIYETSFTGLLLVWPSLCLAGQPTGFPASQTEKFSKSF